MEWINHTNVLKSINFVIVGDCYHQIAAELGKRGTTTDLSIYDRKTQNIIYTWTIPVTFPDKIQSLMQAINIAEYAILNVTKLDKYLGEQVLALDAANLKEGFVLHSYEIDEVELKKMVKGTTISNYRFLDNIDQLKQEISQVEPNGVDGECLIQIDHAFNVKGVGTVLLGIIKRGSVKTFDRLKILPTGTEILVKSIQMHDDPVSESKSPARVGLAVKGVDAADISRGDVLCSSNTQSVKLSIEDAITASFAKSAYFKGNIMENQIYSISIGVQIKPVKIKCVNVNMIEITPDKPLTYFSGQSYALLKPDNYNGTRIIGKGIIK
ncbi:MAG TPA: EF-Tu/IF-2/RF-3 family GTPase [Nitrososphaeraceae archaeon]|nr:EF-Tu/IF-2/RF-3 family GTPase [Nitrososphaeraceae archaeon]